MTPIEKNKTYIAKITDLSSDGNGVAKINGFTVFVPMSLPGDEGEILIVKLKTAYAYGKLTKLIKASEDRTEPLCKAYTQCGGCAMLHCKYSAQLEYKKRFVEDALQRIGGFKDFSVSEIIGTDAPCRYRNKMVFPFGDDKDDNIQYGFFKSRSHEIVPLDDCLLGDELNMSVLKTVKEHMQKYDIKPYREDNHTGLVRRVFTRKAYHTDEFAVVISINGRKMPHCDELVRNITELSENITGIFLNVNKGKNNLVLGNENILVYGADVINDTLCGIKYEISPNSFFQINPIQTEKLYKKAIEYADITSQDNVLDIYCGIGTISLYAAKFAKNVTGIEIVEDAVKNAKQNASNNNITNAKFYAGSAQQIIHDVISDKTDIVILDPPRKGSDAETLSAIANASPKRIVYVSCNPSTLARDTKYLSELGYLPKAATAVDMFPHTTHVETVLLLEKI